jgi:hypothetical protein
MVSVVMAALREISFLSVVCLAAEQARPLAAPVYAVPLEVGDVRSQWWGLTSLVAHNVGFDHNPSRRIEEREMR